MARVRHQGPEFSVIDENIGDKIVKEDDVRGFMAHIKEPELALLKKFDAEGPTCVRIHLLKGEGVSERECVRYTEKESASFLVGAKDG